MIFYEVMFMHDMSKWNESVAYADELYRQLTNEGFRVVKSVYFADEGKFGADFSADRVGISFKVVDEKGNTDKTYYTGVFQSFEQMKDKLDYMADRIRSDSSSMKLQAFAEKEESKGRTFDSKGRGFMNLSDVKKYIAEKKASESKNKDSLSRSSHPFER